jgi:hypothetical protein
MVESIAGYDRLMQCGHRRPSLCARNRPHATQRRRYERDISFGLTRNVKQYQLNTSNSRLLANHPTFNKAILEVAKSINPSGTLLPNASGAGLSNIENRIAEIEGRYMRAPHGSDRWKSYWAGDSGARMQQEYRGLLATREQARRGGAG